MIAPNEPVGGNPFESKPRWSGAPPICNHANLPAYETEAAARDYYETKLPGCHIHAIRHCPFCGRYHVDGSAPDPTGATSGTGRSTKRI